MNYETTTMTNSQSGATIRRRSTTWMLVAIGASVGAAAVAYSRRRRSPWDRAKDRATELIDAARDEMKPWMGIAAGTAAAGTALAVYARGRRQSPWERVSRRTTEMASRVGSHTPPWMHVGLSAAIALASAASAKKARRRTIRGINENTAERINALTDRGLRLLRHLRSISDQTGKLYPRLRRVVA